MGLGILLSHCSALLVATSLVNLHEQLTDIGMVFLSYVIIFLNSYF